MPWRHKKTSRGSYAVVIRKVPCKLARIYIYPCHKLSRLLFYQYLRFYKSGLCAPSRRGQLAALQHQPSVLRQQNWEKQGRKGARHRNGGQGGQTALRQRQGPLTGTQRPKTHGGCARLPRSVAQPRQQALPLPPALLKSSPDTAEVGSSTYRTQRAPRQTHPPLPRTGPQYLPAP